MEKIQDIYRVVENKKLCERFWRLSFDADRIRETVLPGQFVHIRVEDSLEPFFRRPFSVYRAKKYVEIFYEVVGPGTRKLSEKKPGDPLDVLGPVGTPFILPSENIRHVVMIAGGIGVAPFLIMTDHLRKRGLRMSLLYGGRTAGHVYDMSVFEDNNCEVMVATDDGEVGHHGLVTDLLEQLEPSPDSSVIYTCGPHAMMRAVQKLAVERGIPGQAACEEVMACALGACLGCSIPTIHGYKTVCYDGPCFDLREIIFE